ncbi:hypothetical protein LT493_12110 [Streptomyces tricolor]|nr:hypothetical protein [Streptomyces tricolor]
MGSEGVGDHRGRRRGDPLRGRRPGVGMFERSLGPVAVADERMVKPLPDGCAGGRRAHRVTPPYQCLVDVAGTRPGDTVLDPHRDRRRVGLRGDPARPAPGRGRVRHRPPRQAGDAARLGRPPTTSRSPPPAPPRFRRRVPGRHRRARGVDVVLNSLSGKARRPLPRRLLGAGRPGFAEMGKTDLRDVAATEAEHPGDQLPGVQHPGRGAGSDQRGPGRNSSPCSRRAPWSTRRCAHLGRPGRPGAAAHAEPGPPPGQARADHAALLRPVSARR